MGWRDWSYWLRGGVIGLIIGMVFFILLLCFILTDSEGFGTGIFILMVYPTTILIHSFFNLNQIIYTNFWHYLLIFDIIIGILSYFIIGLILGWIYGKIKNRNK